jgi:hypothetical protein
MGLAVDGARPEESSGREPSNPDQAPPRGRVAPSWIRRVGRVIHQAAWEPVSPLPLAAFRIAFSLVLLAEFLYCVDRRHLFFLESPLTETIAPAVIVDLSVWFVALLGCLIGFLTPIAALISYLYVVKYFGCDGYFVYHADMLYVPSALLLIVLPTYRCWSVDRLLIGRLFKIDLARHPVPRLFSNVAIYWVMGFMYFDSTLYKLQSPFWLDGLGFWLPASFPSFTTISWNFLLNQRWLVEPAGYLTLLFELAFIFVFWIKRARKYLFVVGMVLHLGIAIVLPIPLFGLLMVVYYLHFFPDPALNRAVDAFWGLWRRLPWPNGKRSVPPSHRLLAPAGPFLRLDRLLGYLLLTVAVGVSLVQAGVTFRLPIFSPQTHRWMRSYAGVTGHRVFGQWQFTVMTQELALVYYDAGGAERWIPWVNRDGHVGRGAYGRFWSFWWLQSLPDVGNPAAWARVAEAWARDEGVDLEWGRVVAKVRPVINRHVWEKDRQRTMEGIPWSDRLVIRWQHGQRHFARAR